MKRPMTSPCFLALLGGMLMIGAEQSCGQATKPVYLDASQPDEKRVEDLLSRLTLEEKISLIHADSKFTTAAIPRLGIPRRWLDDGPHGVREESGRTLGSRPATRMIFPRPCLWASAWRRRGIPTSAFAEGEAIGAGSPGARQGHHARARA